MQTLIVYIEYDEKERDLTYVYNVVDHALHEVFDYDGLRETTDVSWRFFPSLTAAQGWEDSDLPS